MHSLDLIRSEIVETILTHHQDLARKALSLIVGASPVCSEDHGQVSIQTESQALTPPEDGLTAKRVSEESNREASSHRRTVKPDANDNVSKKIPLPRSIAERETKPTNETGASWLTSQLIEDVHACQECAGPLPDTRKPYIKFLEPERFIRRSGYHAGKTVPISQMQPRYFREAGVAKSWGDFLEYCRHNTKVVCHSCNVKKGSRDRSQNRPVSA